MRRHRRLRPDRGSALHLDLRVEDPRLEQLDTRRSRTAAAARRRAPPSTGHRPYPAVERGPRGDQPARGPRRVRQGRGRAVSLSDRVNLGDLFDPGLDPDKTALIAVDTDGDARHFSYRVLDRATAALAAELSSRGLRRGARIALLGANSAEYLVAYFAIMRAGLVAVPVNTRLPNGTIHFIFGDAAAEFAFADRARIVSLQSDLPSAAFDTIAIETAPDTHFETRVPANRELAMILYTSGSTGRPKGVLLSHAGQLLALRTRIATFPEPAAERFLVAAPLYHMNALLSAKRALMAG